MTTFRQQMADYAKGQVLRELRKQTGMSREKVAAELGVTTKTLYSWENDGGIMRENAEKLAAFYKVEDSGSLITRDDAGGDQLDRLEAKLDLILEKLGVDASSVRFAAVTHPDQDHLRSREDLAKARREEERMLREGPAAADQGEGRQQHG